MAHPPLLYPPRRQDINHLAFRL